MWLPGERAWNLLWSVSLDSMILAQGRTPRPDQAASNLVGLLGFL